MTCEKCFSNLVCQGTMLHEMYKDKAERCPYFHNKDEYIKIVRCKDCRYKKVGYGQFGSYYYCSHITSGLRDIEETDFCNYGERRSW